MICTTECNTDIVEFVRLGYQVSLDWRVHLNNRATFNAAMNLVRGYNNFDGPKVSKTIGSVYDDAMHVEFGRERSPVLYVTLPFWTHQRIGSEYSGMGDPYSREQM